MDFLFQMTKPNPNLYIPISYLMGFPGDPEGKASACSAGDPGLIPRSGRSPGEGIGNPLQYSCLENSMDRVGWWATVHGVTKSQTRLSDLTFAFHPAEILCNPYTSTF